MSDAVIQSARIHWALGDSPIRLIAARENRVYRVDTPAGPTALRVHRPGYRSTAQIESELQWMDMLASNAIGVPKPVAAIDGKPIQHCAGVALSMLTWVSGTPLSKIEVTAKMYFELGHILARMHTLADNWTQPAGFTRPQWDLVGEQPSWDRFWENPQLTVEQAHRFVEFRDKARDAVRALDNPDYGLIHADLVPDNVLIEGNQLRLIDFDDGGFGYRLFDLATILFRSRRYTRGDGLARATVDGYASERSVDRKSLPLFEAMRACSYVGWNMSRMNEARGKARNERFIAEAESAVIRFMAEE